MGDAPKRNDYATALRLLIGAALLMGLLWLMIDTNRFHVAYATHVATPSQPASPPSTKATGSPL